MKFAKSSHESFTLGGGQIDSTPKEIPTAAFVTGLQNITNVLTNSVLILSESTVKYH